MTHSWIKYYIDIFFGLGLFFNAILFIPQALRIYRFKRADELSLLTFLGFNAMQFFSVLHGYLSQDYILMIGFLLSFITCGIVTIFIIIYRRNSYE